MRLSRQVIAWESFLLVWMIFLLVEGTQLDSMVLCWFLWKFFPSLSPSQKGGMVPWKDHWLWNQADLGLDLTSSTS